MREIRLVSRAAGLPRPENFEIVETPVPDGEGVLVRNLVFHVFPGLRMLVGAGGGETPMPRLRPGDTLVGAAVGEVVSAPDDASVRPGDLVSHWPGWREYALLPEDRCVRLDDELPDAAAHGAPMRIGDAAAAAGTTPRALRFYEERGLLPPPPDRTASGQREYTARHVERVRAVRELLSLGLTIEDLARVAHRLDALVDGNTCTVTQAADGRAPGGGGVASARLAALDAEIARLTGLRARLAARLSGDEGAADEAQGTLPTT
ncbi:MerR family transcriptional regulator [Actinomadura oligospora]|uniref:MerR family transcriptional regulator n=1 Tax=Actinomadura oligospora TaxID=111804 RepID=UPI000A01C88D|nr:MerR family transcriptional regulator [Actinomadura oligospora]